MKSKSNNPELEELKNKYLQPIAEKCLNKFSISEDNYRGLIRHLSLKYNISPVEARKEVEVMGDKTSQDKLSKALSDWYDVHSVSSRGLSRKAMMGGGKIKKKNYAPGGSVRSASY